MIRGKKRIGYELEIKIKFVGQAFFEGCEVGLEMCEFCDDGSDPECRIFVTQEKVKD